MTKVVVNEISAHKGVENEVLIPSKTDFQVENFTEESGKTIVELSEVDPTTVETELQFNEAAP